MRATPRRRRFATVLNDPAAKRPTTFGRTGFQRKLGGRATTNTSKNHTMKTTSYSILTVVAFVLVSGCQKAPQAELDAARAALMQADSVEADIYVSEVYVAALDSFNAAQSEIEVEDAKSAFARDYAHAGELLAFTQQTAQDAADQVATNKEAVRLEADSLISIAQGALAAQPEPTTSTVVDSDSPSVTTLVNDAVAARDMGDFMTARNLAQTAVDQLGQTTAPAETIVPRS